MSSNAQSFITLKTHLKLAVTRLRLLQKKRTELAQKTRTKIKDFIVGGKPERAKLLAEHVIREDYLIEALEMVEMYCDLLLVRFDVLTQMKDLDDGLREAVASLIWVTSRMQSDVPEIKVICDLLMMKFGRVMPEKSRLDVSKQVNRKLQNKLLIQCPSRMLVEKYLMEIARCFNIEYKADQDGERRDIDNSDLSISEACGYEKYSSADTLSQTHLLPSVSCDDKKVNLESSGNNNGVFLQLPSVPSHRPHPPSDDVLIDDITKRYQALKKK